MTSSPRTPSATDITTSRRAFLLAGGALTVSACGTTDRGPRSSAVSGAVDHRRGGADSLRRPSLPSGRRWRPGVGEVEPQVKLAAARLVEALGTVPVAKPVGQRLTEVGASPDLAERAGALVPPTEPAVVDVVYPQYGGLTDTTASVMTVAAQSWLDDGRVQRRTVTADIRLSLEADGWRVSDVLPVEPTGATLPRSSPAARLADTDLVELPDAAMADLASGVVDPLVIEALLTLSERFGMSVSVFRSGHPTRVFGTNQTSNHARGRAADIWAIDGRPVVTMGADDRTLVGFLTAAGTTGSDEIGGPIVPDEAGGAYFTNALHRDHVHIGFDR